jgi:hypothetical protein
VEDTRELFRPVQLWHRAVKTLKQANYFLRNGDKARAWKAACKVQELQGMARQAHAVDSTIIPTAIAFDMGGLNQWDIQRMEREYKPPVRAAALAIEDMPTQRVQRVNFDTEPIEPVSRHNTSGKLRAMPTTHLTHYTATLKELEQCTLDIILDSAWQNHLTVTGEEPTVISVCQRIYEFAETMHRSARTKYLPLLVVNEQVAPTFHDFICES